MRLLRPYSRESILSSLGLPASSTFDPRKTMGENAGESLFGDENGNSAPPEDSQTADGQEAPDEMHECNVTARVLGGNQRTVGRAGGLSGDTVGDFIVMMGSAAVDPVQWGGKEALRQYGSLISGLTFGGQSFQGITDVIGSDIVPDVRGKLTGLNPGAILLELVDGKDEGVTTVTLHLPKGMQCPG